MSRLTISQLCCIKDWDRPQMEGQTRIARFLMPKLISLPIEEPPMMTRVHEFEVRFEAAYDDQLGRLAWTLRGEFCIVI